MAFFGILSVLLAVYFSAEVEGHGYMIVPPNRASLWRLDSAQPSNYDDNQYFCGGFFVQYYENQGKCGPCGDNWADPVPRSNENGGIFGNGIITGNYTAGSIIEVTTLITANHLGNLFYHICELTDPNESETEECFKLLTLADGTKNVPVGPHDYEVKTKLKLPDDLTCERCVLRWHYRTGNSWGMCDDGTQGVGCGSQEIFRSCSDIRIVAREDSDEYTIPDLSGEIDNSITGEDYILDDSDKENIANVLTKNDKPCIISPYYNPHGRRNKEFKLGF